ncbi:hypothetical protein HYU09_05445 [Candidatus Woesearchaeota archaeon]|nr:hypothetical protein [Candidatus Woesearchaeota archaeon]
MAKGVYWLPFLKKDVNMGLLFIVLLAVIMFVFSSVFYNKSINGMQEDYGKKVENLQEIEKRLMAKEERINELLKSKDLMEKDKEILEKSYLEIESENQDLRNRVTTSFTSFQKALCKKTGNVECLG